MVPDADVYQRFQIILESSLTGKVYEKWAATSYLPIVAGAVLRRVASFPMEEESNRAVVEAARKCLSEGAGNEVSPCVV